MDNASVYRVQHQDTGNGPYNNGAHSLHEMLYAHCDDESRPGPQNDGLPWDFPYSWLFGFDSKDDLAAWFDGWLEELDAHGYVVSLFSVPPADILRGGHQVIFSHQAQEIARTRPTALDLLP